MEGKDFLQPVPDREKQGWEATSTDFEGNTSEIQLAALKSQNARMGVEVSYGQNPEGYDGWAIREPNGGGSVTIPYFWLDGELFVGTIRQERKKMGGLSTEASRGFSLPQESHQDTAEREFAMETGVESLGSRIKPIGRRGVNPNSAFFVANTRKGEGVKFFGLEVKSEEVVLKRKGQRVEVNPDGTKKVIEDSRRDVYKFTPQLQGQIRELNEKIKPEGIKFFNSRLLSETGDGFTLQAIAKLQAQKP
ncbi:MAG: hypothetical protein A2798_00215 [Candidatus Levybacteria bacterium RIFCSPHIGHO2_01_FULL_37_17]|nr:MAG: hypothetical protein A2798_00215 [Candidatus Levybacteria bacterium RIFCSPHIGHO2_01_FULL_37_17]OGH36481.1 MAG: hypothetical protein A2959_03150 [Candidatus Levybacteria bacterium RIFCSPLOWO2_01_FULL_38_23]